MVWTLPSIISQTIKSFAKLTPKCLHGGERFDQAFGLIYLRFLLNTVNQTTIQSWLHSVILKNCCNIRALATAENQLGINQPKICLFVAHSNGNRCKYFALFFSFCAFRPKQHQQHHERYTFRIISCSFILTSHGRWDFTLETFTIFKLYLLWTL